MKAYFKLLIVPLLIATACSPSYVGTSAFQDDIYYVPGEETLIDKEMAVYTTHAEKKEPIIEQTIKTEPTSKATFSDDREFQLIQEQYRQMLANDSIESIDTTYYNEEEGYYINEFKGSDYDREEAERLRQWYPQGFGYYDNSGYNMAMWLAGDPDWNVYVDGDNVWWTPTWTNFGYYNSFNFSPARYGRTFAYNYSPYCGSNFGFGLGFGFYDDFYWSLNFGWGHSYYNNYPYYGNSCYPYYGHNYHHGNYYGSGYSNNYYGHRSSMGSKAGTNRAYTNRRSATITDGTVSRVNRSAGYTKSGTTTRRSAATAQDAIRRSTAAQKYGTRNNRSSYSNRVGTSTRRTNTTGTVKRSNYQGTTTRYGTQNRSTYQGTKSGTTTRRRTSNYTKPQSNSRPSYNNSGTKRSTNMRGTSTRTSNYSKVKSTPSYNRSSTKSSSSSYRAPSSSSSRSSGAVRSSSSSSRSSNSGNRSSGSTTRRR
ncbi:hypothetical protein DWB61_10575 [Ancylomarina euxinus]|uniref:Vitellogenin II n=1 Tax=Ancylomarina euxinus TaxID=2283627 RepID=A0A425Y0B2_9BACT|nr:hypothetical protein [Ancylomarina euxinus]MCZ4695272.1 hypothetical protein [Ancylomarina euxinus]MUP15469.1 hypothetical protein [Ancylomarina euxinus]RRG21178.1 hypothetical protein DWB61_10575 [Ancylomarina euxinus]